ncbi:GH25 family lysozyme [Lactobacillus gigeriorum]|uniref:GH25 family lysozyme n=1 Tax=Lactobacillus gigeriorum TaxID=1203069 RepID=UPI0009E7B9B1|nr:GH25 family lysozyme [Lactobacillus gigeriorum]
MKLKKLLLTALLSSLIFLFPQKVDAARRLGIDVSSYQRSDYQFFQNMKANGTKFVIVKLGGSGGGEGEHYQNPKASQQLAMAQKVGLEVGSYFWGEFGGSVAQAKKMAKYAVSDAQKFGLKKGSAIALDYELGASQNKEENTKAIHEFMSYIKKQGYKPLLYSGSYYLKTNVNHSKVNKSFKNSLWIASYATMAPVNGPNYNYFPSLDGIAIWQFSSAWYGVDGNVELLKNSLKLGKVKDDVKVTKTKKSKATSYTVKAGDSWYSIAQKFGMDQNQLAKLNGGTVNSELQPGDKLKLTGTIKNDAKPTKVKTKIVKVKSLGKDRKNWKVRLIDGSGKYSNHYVNQGSRWITSKTKETKKGKAYLIGKNLYVLAKYVKIE